MNKILYLILFAALTLIGCNMDETISMKESEINPNGMLIENGYNPTVSVYSKDSMTLMDVLGMPDVMVNGCKAVLNDGSIIYPQLSDRIINNGLSVFGNKLFKKPLETNNHKVEIEYVIQNMIYTKIDSGDNIKILIDDIPIPITFDVTIDGWINDSLSIDWNVHLAFQAKQHILSHYNYQHKNNLPLLHVLYL